MRSPTENEDDKFCRVARAGRRAALGLALLVCMVACRPRGPAPIPIIVASSDSPEQLVIGKMTVLALRAAGYEVVDRTNLGKPWAVRSALRSGAIDVCWEYTGDTWTVHLAHDQPIADPHECFRRVREKDIYNQINWVAMAPYRRSMVFLMHSETATRHKVKSVSDLARVLNRVDPYLRLCVPETLYKMPSGIRGLERVYGMSFNAERLQFMSMAEAYKALARGECDCMLGYTSDAEVTRKEVRILEDDRAFFHASNLAVAARVSILHQYPALELTLADVSRQLTQEAVAEMVQQVAAGGKPEAVAKRFLSSSRAKRQPTISK